MSAMSVIAGLDPAIHPLWKEVFTKRMDPRVKPAGDRRVGAHELNDRVYHVHTPAGAQRSSGSCHRRISAALSAATTINNGSVFAWPGVEGLRARGNTGSDCKIRGCRRSPPARTFRRLADYNWNERNGPY